MRPYGILDSIEKEGGITLSTPPAPPEVTAAASTLAGIWLAEPMTATWELIYSPHLELTTFDCDPEATSRFLPD